MVRLFAIGSPLRSGESPPSNTITHFSDGRLQARGALPPGAANRRSGHWISGSIDGILGMRTSSRVRRATEAVAVYYGRSPVQRARVIVSQNEDKDESIHGTTWGDVQGGNVLASQ
jgi:hypothetical protein